MLTTILIFLAVLSLLVLVHEWGHYITARWTGMHVEEFSIGFPPRLYSWKRKSDGMKWTIGALPLGGFVKIKGENPDDEEAGDGDSFAKKAIWQKVLVLVAGVSMNVILAMVLFAIGFSVGVPSVIEGNMPKLAQVRNEAVTVTTVLPGSSAEGVLKMGDEIRAVDGVFVRSGEEARILLGASQGNVELDIVRGGDGDIESVTLEKAWVEEMGQDGIGAGIATTGLVRYPLWYAPFKGIVATFTMLLAIIVAFWDLFAGLVSGGGVSASVAGPVGIAVVTGEIASLGIVYLMQFAGMLSLNLAILNILPIPALDGGRLVFVMYEAIFRKPMNAKVEAVIHNLGFVALMALVIIVTYRDVVTRL